MPRETYDEPRDTLYYSPQSEESRYLAERDEDMAMVIEAVGEVRIDIEADGFISLARAICDQQISLHAARAIWGRLVVACGGQVTAETLARLSDEQLRACGFSARKASYLRDLSAKTLDGTIDFTHLAELDDEDIIEKLVCVKGIGRWTAEMFLIFALKRPDVFALDDGGLRRAVCRLKGLESNAPKALLEAISEQWAPQRTCASLYLWRWMSGFPTS